MVEWWDHCAGADGWKSLLDALGSSPVLIVSAGWVVKETSKFITILPHMGGLEEDGVAGTECCRGELSIVKTAIKSRTTLSKFDRMGKSYAG